jgi:hypothetical protein
VWHHGQYGDRDDRDRDAVTFARRVEELAATLRPGAPVPELDRIEGADRSGTVHCVVDRFGAVQDVHIDPGWWAALGPTRVAAAVLDALSYARSKAALAMTALGRHGHRPQLPPAPEIAPPIDVPHVDSPGFERAIEARLDRAFAMLEAARRLRESIADPQPRTVSGPSRLFRVTVLGTVVQGAEVDEDHLGPYAGNELANDARLALQEAARLPVPAS